MLQLAESRAEELGPDFERAEPVRIAPPAMPVPAPAVAVDRYGARSRPNLPVILLILLLHAAVILALVQVRQNYIRAKEAKLTVVNLTPPPPPPAAQQDTPPPSKPEVVAPPPIVQTSAPAPQIATTPDPAPRPTSVAVASAVPGPPAPVVAPPAPPSTVQGGDLASQMVAGKPPRYPVESRRKREQGTVVLSLTLGLDGAVEAIGVSHSSGFRRLDDAALDAVRRWRWKPMMRDGQPVRVRGVVEIPFVLQA